MSTNVYVKLIYGVLLNEEELKAKIDELNGYNAYEVIEELLTDEFSVLEMVDAKGMYDADEKYLIAVKDSVLRVDEDDAVTAVDVVIPSDDQVALLNRFVKEVLGQEPEEPGWKMTVKVS